MIHGTILKPGMIVMSSEYGEYTIIKLENKEAVLKKAIIVLSNDNFETVYNYFYLSEMKLRLEFMEHH